MKDIEELGDRMIELIKIVAAERRRGDGFIFTPQAVEIIEEISAFAKTTAFYQANAERAAEFWAICQL